MPPLAIAGLKQVAKDANQIAARVIAQATHGEFVPAGVAVKNPAAAALGRLGGKSRAAKLSPAQRSEIARLGGLSGGRGRK